MTEVGGITGPRRPVRLLAAALVLALAALAVAVVLLFTGDDDGPVPAPAAASGDLVAAEAAAESAAREAVTSMTTYDYRSLDRDFAWVQDAGTEAFQRYFAESSADSQAVITRLRAVATGEVVDAAATAADATHVKVLLFVDQTLEVPGQEAKVDQPRLSVQMVLQDGRWLVDQVAVNDRLTSP